MIGHSIASCPYGDPAGGGNVARAEQLVKQSGMAGTPVTVWSQTRAAGPAVDDVLHVIPEPDRVQGDAELIADATYFSTIGNLKLNPQTGYSNWVQDFPNPIDFYVQLQGTAILPTNNENLGQVNDPRINSQSKTLGQVPTSQLNTVAGQWQSLDEYVARKAYIGVFGYGTSPAFTSDRIAQNYVFHPVYGLDLSSLQVK